MSGETKAMLDGIDLSDRPWHIRRHPADRYAICGHRFTEVGDVPWQEIPVEDQCPRCVELAEGRRPV